MSLFLRMFKKMRFSIIILMWGICYLYPFGQFWGLAWIILAIIGVWTYPKHTEKIEFSNTFSKDFFNSPKLIYDKETFVLKDNEQAQLKNYYSHINKVVPLTQNGMFRIAPIISIILLLAGFEFDDNLVEIGQIVIILNALNLLMFFIVYFNLYDNVKYLKYLSLDFDSNIKRPKFDIKSKEDRETIARYYNTAFEAQIALTLMKKFKVKKMIYPEDNLLWAIERKQLPKLINYLISNNFESKNITFGQLVGLRYFGSDESPKFSDINPAVIPSPPWSKELTELMKGDKDGYYELVDDYVVRKIFAGEIGTPPRPPFNEELFYSYWQSCDEAKIAYNIRKIILKNLDLEDYIMIYPNDPVAIMVAWIFDEFEMSGFICDLETHYQIELTESEINNLLHKSNLQEAVNLISTKLKEKS